MLISGPPGTGKTLLAKAGANLLPPPSLPEQIAITKIHSLNSLCTKIIDTRPYRAPHHSCSLTSLIGGGPNLIPGEISLAHLGILHLDEFPEFPRDRIEALRQPLENHSIKLTRIGQQVNYPADFMLIATMNPCPCGYFGSSVRACTCKPSTLYNYQRKLSGPILDRIDIHVNLSQDPNSLRTTSGALNHPQQTAAEQLIITAIHQQNQRYHDTTTFNSRLSSYETTQYIQLTHDATAFLEEATQYYHLSARSYFKLIKLAQTIADLEAAPQITAAHIAEAAQYRLNPPSPAP